MIRKLIRESIKKILKENSISFKAGEYGSSKPHTLGCNEDGLLIIDGQKYVVYKVKFGMEVSINVDSVYMSNGNIMLKGSLGPVVKEVPLKNETVNKIVEEIENPSFRGVFSFVGSEGDTFKVKRQN
jgi:hypothetical protein